MKVADAKDGYSYSTDHSTGYADLGNKGPQPNTALNKKADQALSLQGTVGAGWEHYQYAGQGDSGYSKRKGK